MSYDKENIFAKILKGEIPCDKVFEMSMCFHSKILAQKQKHIF